MSSKKQVVWPTLRICPFRDRCSSIVARASLMVNTCHCASLDCAFFHILRPVAPESIQNSGHEFWLLAKNALEHESLKQRYKNILTCCVYRRNTWSVERCHLLSILCDSFHLVHVIWQRRLRYPCAQRNDINPIKLGLGYRHVFPYIRLPVNAITTERVSIGSISPPFAHQEATS